MEIRAPLRTVAVAAAVFQLLIPCCSKESESETAGRASAMRVRLPRDDGSHQSMLEWWYWTGHLRTETGRWFGFELVFFHLRMAGALLQVTHHAISDVQDGSFHYRIEKEPIPEVTFRDRIDLAQGDLRAAGEDGRDRLGARLDGYELELALESRKAPVLQHGAGYIAYDFGGETYYYSRTRMDARGTLRAGAEQLRVTGSAWFDHQWGEMGNVFDQGWDWFGIQLDDDSEIMVFRMRAGGQEVLRGGSYSPAAGEAIRLTPEEVEVTPVGEWTSPHTGCSYPRQWTLGIRGKTFTLAPVLADQELWDSIPRYWEGAATVSGAGSGRAFIELNGYCR